MTYHTPEEEIAYGPACWLWDYLRRSGVAGYFLPISGGADSSSVATIVGSMCQLVAQAAQAGNRQVIRDARRITAERVRIVFIYRPIHVNLLTESFIPVTWRPRIVQKRHGIVRSS